MRHLSKLEVSAISGAATLGGYTFSDIITNGFTFGCVTVIATWNPANFPIGVGIGAGYTVLRMGAGALDDYFDLQRPVSSCAPCSEIAVVEAA